MFIVLCVILFEVCAETLKMNDKGIIIIVH